MPFAFFCACSIVNGVTAPEGVFLSAQCELPSGPDFANIAYISMGIANYFRDTAAEMRRVSWPTRTQAVVYTALVIVISIIVALFLSGFDFVFTNLLQSIT